MARIIDERWFDLLRKYKDQPEVEEIIAIIENSARLSAAFKNITGKTLSQILSE
jgi:hypothetical protein